MGKSNSGDTARGLVERFRDARESAERTDRQLARASVAAALFGSAQHRVATEVPVIGRYQVRRRLGSGGMGSVFAAYDPKLKRDLALKLLHRPHDSSLGHNPFHEARIMARLSHDAIVAIYDVGLHEGRVFIAMEQICGQSMQRWLRTPRPWRSSVAIMARAARGIEAAHLHGVIHRDFKPGNVLLGRDGRVCVADFGLARETVATKGTTVSRSEGSSSDGAKDASLSLRLTQRGAVVGTPAYMAPEQYLGTVQDERTDQFAFCISLYQALFGKRPFDGSSFSQLRDSTLSMTPTIPASDDIPDALCQAVLRGLSKIREQRFGSMGELATLLESLSKGVDLARILSAPADFLEDTEVTTPAEPSRDAVARPPLETAGLPLGRNESR